MKDLVESVVTSKGQTTLPKKVRDALGLEPGDKLRYAVLGNGGVWFGKVQPISRLAGMLKYDGPPVSLEDMKRGMAAAAAARYLRTLDQEQPAAQPTTHTTAGGAKPR